MNGKYTIEGHTPIECDDVMAWAKWFESADRNVARSELGSFAWMVWLGRLLKTRRFEPVRVSTVFLGLDHNYLGDGEPLLFETMIFGGIHDEEQWRYSTWNEAVTGHYKAVKVVRS